MAVRDGYLDRPIIDEYGLALEAAIRSRWCPASSRARAAYASSSASGIDEIGIPFSARDVAVQLLARRSMATGLRVLAGGVARVVPGSLRQVMEICALAEEHGLGSALYWKASAARKLTCASSTISNACAHYFATWARIVANRFRFARLRGFAA